MTLSRLTVPGRRGPADHRRNGARSAADHDVLRRPALQPHGVDDNVEEDGEGQQRGRQPVDQHAERHHRKHRRAPGQRSSASPGRMRPVGIGRLAVRDIKASMSASYHMLSAPEAPAPTAIASTAMTAMNGLVATGAATSPTNAVKTTSDITRGFSSAK